MDIPLIEISDQPNPEVERLLGSGLAAFNESITGYNDRQPLTVLIKDPATQQIVGGITGKTTLGMASTSTSVSTMIARCSGDGCGASGRSARVCSHVRSSWRRRSRPSSQP
jgi:hypothetical protein